ncbi:hypothetical protein [Moorena sp. SIO3F7]|uniref:hypothetical protein n=2 Tax=unclassified Moorena TaxID=2683338 RepID=UPI0014016237|nr:hypothetical protein [Moorena sp. SIO3F7]NEP98624.1 hypothetical protein [Moorena sp. SIO3F7]
MCWLLDLGSRKKSIRESPSHFFVDVRVETSMINNSCSVLDSLCNLQPNPNQEDHTGATSQGIVVISPLDDLETGEDLATTGDLDITNGPINVKPPIESQRIIDFDDIDQVFDLEIQPQDGTTANITKIEISSHRTVDPDDPLVKVSSRATAINRISPNPLAKGHATGTGNSGGGVVMVSSSSTATSTISDNTSGDLRNRISSIHGTAMVSSTISNPNTNNYHVSGAAGVTTGNNNPISNPDDVTDGPDNLLEGIVGTITNPIDSLLGSFQTPSLFTPSLFTSSLGFPSSGIDLDQSRSLI